MNALSHILPVALSQVVQRLKRARSSLGWARRYWAVAAYWLLSAALIAWIGWEATTTRLITYRPGADYWEHSAALHALMEHPWSPGNPHLKSDVGSPRYNPLFVVIALVSRSLGFGAIEAMGLAACLNLALFTAGVFWFFGSYFRDRRAPLFAFFVLFMSWWDGWHFSNVYQLQILPSVAAYPSTSALALTWFCFALAAAFLRAGSAWLHLCALALLSGTVLLVHPLTAMLTFSGLLGLALFEPGAARRTRAWLLLSVLLGALAAHFWPYYSPFEVLSGGNHATTAGWLGKAAERVASEPRMTGANRLFYNTKNLRDAVGFALPGVLCVAALLWRRKHLFIPLGLLLTLGVFIANSRVPIPLGHRFILLAIVYIHIATVWGCLRFTPGYQDASPWMARPWPARVAALLLLIVFAVAARHNILLANKRIQQAGKLRLSPVLNYARQVGKKAGEQALVLGRAEDSWPIPTFGPKVVSLLHINPLVPDGMERRKDVERFFAGATSEEARNDILRKYAVTHVLANGREPTEVRRFLQQRGAGQRLAAGYRLYTLRDQQVPTEATPAP